MRSDEIKPRGGYVNGVRVIWPEPRRIEREPEKKTCVNGHVGDFMPSGKCRICRREHNRRYYQDNRDRRNANARDRYAERKGHA